jgi:hypothetical protein
MMKILALDGVVSADVAMVRIAYASGVTPAVVIVLEP